MNFSPFPANATNIFPIANSVTGGQLLTEFNLRSRESVLTSESVKYFIGPSYTHSQDDFKIHDQTDDLGTVISSTVLQIDAGKAVVNGHYFETFTSVLIDIAEANNKLKLEGYDVLKGRLGVGLRAVYSTEQTLAASLKKEKDGTHTVEGIQVVILPIGKIESGYFVLPKDSPDNENLVTAHLKLGEITFINGSIRSITNNEDKTQYLPASRVGEFESLLGKSFVTRNGLNPKKLYTFAGKSVEANATRDTWCDSTDSLFIWQKASDLSTTEEPQLDQAEFGIDEQESITLTLPHKMTDGGMYNTSGERVYYNPRIMSLPKADFGLNTPGTVSSSYTKAVKEVRDYVSNLYQLSGGKQRGYVEVLDSTDDLPTINDTFWDAGDYVLVRVDNALGGSRSDAIQAPSSIYVVRPPMVTLLLFSMKSKYNDIPNGLDGVEITRIAMDYTSSEIGGSRNDTPAEVIANLEKLTHTDYRTPLSTHLSDIEKYNKFFGVEPGFTTTISPYSDLRGYSKSWSSEAAFAYTEDQGANPNTIVLEGDQYTRQDYALLRVDNVPDVVVTSNGGQNTYSFATDESTGNKITVSIYFYYIVQRTDGKKVYSEGIPLTGNIQLATETLIGGFLNASDTDLDAGYVIRDNSGRLRLIDYGLLRTGVLAYQLGEDKDFGSGLSIDEIQEELDEYVNDRVAFPTEAQMTKRISGGEDPNVIEIVLNLPQSTTYESLDIKNIDSRFGASILLHIQGQSDHYTTINISNCEKVRIGTLEGNPVINLYNSRIYYDGDMIDYILSCDRVHEADTLVPGFDPNYEGIVYANGFTGISNLHLWFERYSDEDSKIVIDDLTVTETQTPIIPEDVDFWSEQVVNDVHYYYGLQSISFRPDGTLSGCGLYIRNDTTANIDPDEKSVSIGEFTLPQGSTFTYPRASLVNPIKITGNFVTAYPQLSPAGYQIIETNFTALTQKYTKYSDQEDYNEVGSIAFVSKSELVTSFIGTSLTDPDSIDGMEPGSYHVFKGWTIG